MTRHQVLSESPAWLALLVQAARKAQAAQALLDAQVGMTSTAASQTKQGGQFWQKLVRRLERIAGD